MQETKKVLDEYLAKRKAKKGLSVEGAPVEEKSTLHGTWYSVLESPRLSAYSICTRSQFTLKSMLSVTTVQYNTVYASTVCV